MRIFQLVKEFQQDLKELKTLLKEYKSKGEFREEIFSPDQESLFDFLSRCGDSLAISICEDIADNIGCSIEKARGLFAASLGVDTVQDQIIRTTAWIAKKNAANAEARRRTQAASQQTKRDKAEGAVSGDAKRIAG